jgi:hypothetical protein
MQPLSAEQVECYRRFGFAILLDWFSEQKRNELLADVDRTIAATRAERETGQDGCWWSPMLSAENAASHVPLLGRDGFLGAAEQLFEQSFYGQISDATLAAGDTYWHKDQDVPCDLGIKFICYPREPLTADNGALRVLPGTHDTVTYDPTIAYALDDEVVPSSALAPSALAQTMAQLQAWIDERGLVRVCLETNPRDVIAFITPLYHASFNGKSGRVHCSTVYQQTPTDESGWQQRRDDCSKVRENHESMLNWPAGQPFHSPNGSNSRRMNSAGIR